MLTRASWLPIADKLALQDGRSRRVDHDCGEGRTLLLSRDGNRLKAWCFRCNDGDSATSEEPLHLRIARLSRTRAADMAAAATSDVPAGEHDPTLWPTNARLWLAKAGLHSGDAGALGARYNADMQRVVLPCGGGFWQARAVHPDQQPKYLAPHVDKVYPRWGKAETVVLVEDILSAYKVGQVVECWCMLGTSLAPALLSELLARGCAARVWLDNDLPPVHPTNRGQIAAAKIVKQLRGYGVAVRNIVSSRDPKLMSYPEIKELIA